MSSVPTRHQRVAVFSHMPPGRSHKPAQSAAGNSGQIVCNVRGCRPVRKGCRLEIAGAFTEEVCN
jgi:hypothetical protein